MLHQKSVLLLLTSGLSGMCQAGWLLMPVLSAAAVSVP